MWLLQNGAISTHSKENRIVLLSKSCFTRGLLVAAALLGSAKSADQPQDPFKKVGENDPRLERIRSFFAKSDSPAQQYAQDFLLAADQHKLDWRLLPSISQVESSGAKRYRNNNIFGWDNCETRFRTVRHGIYHVASRLAHAAPYRGKDTVRKLRTYNSNPEYAHKVRYFMRTLGPKYLAPASAY